ncbi:protein OCTOPUS-like [Salvia miltiorrhiza]|uniref:protein OCTOPUS-like n=1 Tax=Salvia miltiorrhiza TaxID=226208 RepID=UPI0025AD5226|nr:protein OCTOPUS-like [Salvia miltiorrhiza]
MLPTVMNHPTSTDPTAPPPPPPPRSSFSCDRHPTEQFTGFCPSCLCERLTTLDNSSSNTPSSSRRPSSASAAIKSLFSSASKPSSSFPPPPPPPKPSKPSSSFPELRRSKSFSASKNEALGQFFEPQRKSCDVRVRNTLWTLFTLDDDGGGSKPSAAAAASSSSHQNGKKIGSFSAEKPVFEETENDDDFRDSEYAEIDEIQSVRESHLENSRNEVEFEVNSAKIVEEEANLKIKEHIDLQTQEKKSSSGGFWAAASVFSKKWHKWRRKQKMKKQNNATLPVEKPISRQYRETQSEIADYGFGRRSCDTDPRFSLDAGRVSFDDARYSFDEPRASWDGYLIGRSFPRMAPMVSVMEDAPAARQDMQIPVEDVPGGTMQTKEYYSDSSSSRRRKSLDRSSSIRKAEASVDELKMVSNAKVSPTTADSFHGAKVVGERELSLQQHCLRDECLESCELGSGYRDYSSNSLIGGGGGERKESKKSSRRWSWRIWGFIHRRSKDEEEDSRGNGVERSLSVSWQDNGDVGGRLNINMFRSNSSRIGGSMRKSGRMLERNRSARYSPPSHVDNGLLRFYLTPMRRRGGALGNHSRSVQGKTLLSRKEDPVEWKRKKCGQNGHYQAQIAMSCLPAWSLGAVLLKSNLGYGNPKQPTWYESNRMKQSV